MTFGNLKHLSRCKATGRPLLNEAWGEVERDTPPKDQLQRGRKSWHVPWGPARAWGVARLVGGGRVSGYAPFLSVVDQEGGGYSKIFYGGFTVSQLFSFIVTILLQSEQKRGVLYSLYIYIYYTSV